MRLRRFLLLVLTSLTEEEIERGIRQAAAYRPEPDPMPDRFLGRRILAWVHRRR